MRTVREFSWSRRRDFTYRRCGTTGCEILAPDGSVVAWTADARWAALIVLLLNGACLSRPARCHHGDGGSIGPVEASHGQRRCIDVFDE